MGELTDIIFMQFVFWYYAPYEKSIYSAEEHKTLDKLNSSMLLHRIYCENNSRSAAKKYFEIVAEMWK